MILDDTISYHPQDGATGLFDLLRATPARLYRGQPEVTDLYSPAFVQEDIWHMSSGVLCSTQNESKYYTVIRTTSLGRMYQHYYSSKSSILACIEQFCLAIFALLSTHKAYINWSRNEMQQWCHLLAENGPNLIYPATDLSHKQYRQEHTANTL